MSAEAQLMALALGFYLWDAAHLLHINEAALQAGRKGRWQALFGARQVRLRGKELLLPNPFTPHRPLYLLSWALPQGIEAASASSTPASSTTVPSSPSSSGSAASLPAASGVTPVPAQTRAAASSGASRQTLHPLWEHDATRYRGLAPCLLLSALALFGLLPLCLFLRLGDLAALASLGLMYLGILGASLWLLVHRRTLDLPSRRWWSLLLEGLLCPPLALNLVRKLSLARSPAEDFVQAARRLLSGGALPPALAQCVARIDEELEGEAPDSARALALQALRASLLPAPHKERP